MLNIIQLERRWLRYKIKSYIPHVIIAFSISIISLVITTFIFQDSQVKEQVSLEVREPIVIPKQVSLDTKPETLLQRENINVVIPNNNKNIEVLVMHPIKETKIITHDKSKVQLSPSLDFMKKMQNSVQPYYKNNKNYYTQEEVRTPTVEVVQKSQQKVLEPEVEVKKISIKRQNTQNDIYEIIKRFKKNNNPALSLFVAKKYYELKDYQQAYNYSLMTNGINENIESSWIIFSKSLVKLGKKEKAISVLKNYINNSHSNSAKILLDEIRSGKFR